MTVDELANHLHDIKDYANADSSGSSFIGDTEFHIAGKHNIASIGFPDILQTKNFGYGAIVAAGGNQAHNNTPLSVAAYGWKRVS